MTQRTALHRTFSPPCTHDMPTADQTAPAAEEASPWIAVVGPPGSGGDAIARAMAGLGLGLIESSRPPAVPGRPSGDHAGAGQLLSTAGDVVLGWLEGAWWAPPDQPPGWEHRPEVAAGAPPMVASLEAAVRSALPPGTDGSVEDPLAVWYDLRHALLLPFWRAHQGGVGAAVVTWRQPGSTVAELRSLGIGHMHAIALWEAQLVGALEAARGLPVLGVDVDAATDDPARWAASAARFLADQGFPVADDGEERAGAVLQASSDLRAGAGGPADEEEAASAGRMAAPLALVAGPHHRWDPPGSAHAGRWAAALLEAHLASHRSAHGAIDALAITEDAVRDASSAVAALDWTVDRLVEGWASGRLTDGGPPTLPD